MKEGSECWNRVAASVLCPLLTCFPSSSGLNVNRYSTSREEKERPGCSRCPTSASVARGVDARREAKA
eukprot:748935-Hanusia_phi.AAC.3